MQSLIRTLTGRWGLHMGDLGKGWLELCTEEDYKAAASTACDETMAPCTSRIRVDPPRMEERATSPLWPCVEGVLLCMHWRQASARGREKCTGSC